MTDTTAVTAETITDDQLRDPDARARAAAILNGKNAGWLKRLLMWDWHRVSIERYPGWEIEVERAPAFVKLTHTRGADAVESHKLASAWDDIAAVYFYQRDWTDDGIPFVRDGETYWSGWWFQTIAERDRFLEWMRTRPC